MDNKISKKNLKYILIKAVSLKKSYYSGKETVMKNVKY